MQKISIPKATYKDLVIKARFGEEVLTLIGNQKKYPLEIYSERRIKDFLNADYLSPNKRKNFLAFLKRNKKSA